ncbi:MAG: hypothetical protein E6R04_00950 [Spirochaetes bacterium]|nr:MAG: hypothetical protein E6R04_00950 [Spirochaetota bacterium]
MTTQNEQVIDDVKWGVKYCYCAQHLRVHSTGWCSVSWTEKLPLFAGTLEEAFEEFKRIKRIAQSGEV